MSDRTGKTGVLYIVATPIGNLGDISERARDVLSRVDQVLAEDTRHTGRLLQQLGVSARMTAYHDHNERARAKSVVSKLLEGEDIALVSDAGTPLISDPGFVLVRAAQEAGVRVSPIPGSCSVIAALSASGLATDRFCFEGFLPSKRSARQEFLQGLVSEPRTLVMLESSHRIVSSLQDMSSVLGGEREAVIARELTKRFETIRRDCLAELAHWVDSDNNQQKGEFIVIVAGSSERQAGSGEAERVLEILLEHLSVREAAEAAAGILGERKNLLYKKALELADR